MRIMPHDVCTCWNSTYDMLKFALEYKEAIKMFTLDLKNDLCKFELNDEEWGLVKELSNTLRVMWHNKQHNSHTHCFPLSLYPSSFMLVFQSFRFWRMGWNSSHVEHPTSLLSSWPCPTSIKTSWNKLSQPAKCTPPFDTHLPLQRRCLIAITH